MARAPKPEPSEELLYLRTVMSQHHDADEKRAEYRLPTKTFIELFCGLDQIAILIQFLVEKDAHVALLRNKSVVGLAGICDSVDSAKSRSFAAISPPSAR